MNQKKTCPISHKVSNAMHSRIEEEAAKDHRSIADMSTVLLAEALVIRDAQQKGNTGKYL